MEIGEVAGFAVAFLGVGIVFVGFWYPLLRNGYISSGSTGIKCGLGALLILAGFLTALVTG